MGHIHDLLKSRKRALFNVRVAKENKQLKEVYDAVVRGMDQNAVERMCIEHEIPTRYSEVR